MARYGKPINQASKKRKKDFRATDGGLLLERTKSLQGRFTMIYFDLLWFTS